jgi:hypothetical protein
MGLLNDLPSIVDDPPAPPGLTRCQDSAHVHRGVLMVKGWGIQPMSSRTPAAVLRPPAFADAPVIAMSAFRPKDRIMGTRPQTFQRFMPKPIDAVELCRAVGDLVRRAA